MLSRIPHKLPALIVASAVVTLGAMSVAVEQPVTAEARTQMSTAVTRTESAAPTTLATPVAVPNITGPAALPSEEQGLPG